MRKLVYILTVVIITGCSNANREVEDMATEDVTMVAVDENFDKMALYEEYIREKFEEQMEKRTLAQKHPELSHHVKDSFFALSYGRFKIKSLEIESIDDAEDWTPSFSVQINPEYTYHYKLTKVLRDSITKNEERLSSLVSIKEDIKIIDGDSIPTVEIIWQ
jgi:hypothetical protein